MLSDYKNIRIAIEQDIGDLAHHVNAAYRGDSSRQGWTTEADLLDGQRTDTEDLLLMLKKPNCYFLLLHKMTGELVGSVHLEKIENYCYLGMLTVSPTLQNKGIGKQLLEASENFAKTTWKSEKIKMSVISVRDELIAWYNRQGYHFKGETKPFPFGDPRKGLPKRTDFNLILLEKNFVL
jgi:ribosomal protein S18 acetylase RimI-like enzyme